MLCYYNFKCHPSLIHPSLKLQRTQKRVTFKELLYLGTLKLCTVPAVDHRPGVVAKRATVGDLNPNLCLWCPSLPSHSFRQSCEQAT